MGFEDRGSGIEVRGRLLAAVLVVAGVVFPASAQSPAERAATDAMVIERVAEVSQRDLPAELLERMLQEDLELLRGRRADGSYDYAEWERFEAARIRKSISVQPRSDEMEALEIDGENVYRVILDVPSRRMLFRKNRPIWIERIDVDYLTDPRAPRTKQSIEVKAWMQPGELRPFDLEAIARQASVKVIATAEPSGGYGNIDLTLVQARLVDLPTSPHAEVVTHARTLIEALEEKDVAAVRTVARRMRDAAAVRTAPVAPAPRRDTAAVLELQTELQEVENLLLGSEEQRREGLERLRMIIRNLRP